jgi:hypothetical protein
MQLLLVIISTPLISAACSALSTSRVLFIPIDAAIWTSDLPSSSALIDITVADVENDQRASLQYKRNKTREIRFYPSPLQVLEPVLEAYGSSLIEAFGADSQAVPMSINEFRVLLNPNYDNGKFAVMLQFRFSVANDSRLITAIGSSPIEGRLDTVVIQRAMHGALATAIGHSRLHIGIVLDRPS